MTYCAPTQTERAIRSQYEFDVRPGPRRNFEGAPDIWGDSRSSMFQEHLDAIGGDLLDWLWAHVHAAIIIERNDVQAQLYRHSLYVVHGSDTVLYADSTPSRY
jgi:hypothetical protein